tara:strand:- start:263 stop:580 length:318 start_codon:yes stop_codon:yes gene_type:complete
MKKFLFITFSIFLIFFTIFVKNSTKSIEEEIYIVQEQISLKKNIYEMIKLEYDYLTAPENLIELQKLYFEDELREIDINNLGHILIKEGEIDLKPYLPTKENHDE